MPLHVSEHWSPPELSGEQNAFPCVTQSLSHEPHDVFDVSSASQPSVEFLSQSANPGLQLPSPHEPFGPLHADCPFVGGGHALQSPLHPLAGSVVLRHVFAHSLLPAPHALASLSLAGESKNPPSPERRPGSFPKIALHPTAAPTGNATSVANAK